MQPVTVEREICTAGGHVIEWSSISVHDWPVSVCLAAVYAVGLDASQMPVWVVVEAQKYPEEVPDAVIEEDPEPDLKMDTVYRSVTTLKGSIDLDNFIYSFSLRICSATDRGKPGIADSADAGRGVAEECLRALHLTQLDDIDHVNYDDDDEEDLADEDTI